MRFQLKSIAAAFPNGLVLCRQSYESLMPGDNRGYAREWLTKGATDPARVALLRFGRK